MKKLLTILFLFVSSICFAQHQWNTYVTASGTDTYAVTVSVPTITNYTTKRINLRFANANTGASTLNVTPSGASALGAIAIRAWDGDSWEALVGGEIVTGQDYVVVYNGTYFELYPSISGSGGSFTLTNGSGTTAGATSVDVGGAVTGNTTFTGNFNWTWGSSGSRIGNYRVWSGGTIGLDASTGSFLQSGNNVMNVSPTAATVTLDGTNTFVEASDYSANYTNRSYTAKGYVDAQDAGRQPIDGDLTSWAGITRASGFDTWVTTPSSVNLSATLTDEVGSGLSVFSEQTVNIQTGTTYTLVIGDRYKELRFTNTGAITLTVPPVSSVAFPSGTRIVIIPDSTGTITVAAGSGVDIETSRGALTSLCQDCPMVLEKKTASDAWMLWNGSAISVGALSRVNSTNTNITLGGDPTNALLTAVSMTLSHTGADGDVFVWTDTDTDGKRSVLNATPTAYWHIKAGTASANTSPLKFTSGTLLTTIEAGSVEFNGSHYRTNTALNRIGIGGVIADFTADVANSGTSETDIQTYTTKASTLAATGEKLTARYSGTFADATATAQMKVLFAGNTIFDSGAITLTATGSWDIDVMIIRTGASTARSIVTMRTGAATITTYVTETDITGLTFTNTNILKTTATAGGGGGGSNDIVGKLGSISWSPAAAN